MFLEEFAMHLEHRRETATEFLVVARDMHGLPRALPAQTFGARSLARTLDWVYQGSPNRRVWPDEVTAWPE